MSGSEVTHQLKNGMIYVLLNLRGALPGFHWSLFVPTSKPLGQVWHATNRSGGWWMETKSTSKIPGSVSLCVALELAPCAPQDWDKLCTTLGSVACGEANSGEPFNCVMWVKDAIIALHDAGVIRLKNGVETIKDIGEMAVEEGEEHRDPIEQGTGGAKVIADTGFTV
ncbi:hypothetical protein C7974DRAFT_419947 [Boeremia exigua]|uniref:uncharacterized protein n=1 Tax=Boeremia exigua TaxID=749465 RepID=UPI001E8DEB2E|nr:uncharacterized protein C7974DRAFT_419947 [Boeremia exigua]KAH6644463.1 hypothetical protein C7974DRAFT_419947 [Boeremia exigua]